MTHNGFSLKTTLKLFIERQMCLMCSLM